ncbi:hypothetical protein AAZX31_20G020600 [Glycine max]|nr:hypothetical protein GLYMA_20G022302v4 [Glycine max]KAG4394388.1 hypothetical protein GLYMA_20G022302v4 [Glycine max]
MHTLTCSNFPTNGSFSLSHGRNRTMSLPSPRTLLMHPLQRFLHRQNWRQLRHRRGQPPSAVNRRSLPHIPNHHRPRQTLRRQPRHSPRLRRHRNLCHRHSPQRRHPLPLHTPRRTSLALRQPPPLPPGHLRQNPNFAHSPHHEIAPRSPNNLKPHHNPSLHPSLPRNSLHFKSPQRRRVPPRLRQSHLRANFKLPPRNEIPFHDKPVPVLRILPDPRPSPKPNGGVLDHLTGFNYSNMFDAQMDAVFSAMKRLGFADVELIVAKRVGPLWVTRINRNLKPTVSERNSGLFKPDLTPVYHVAVYTAKQCEPIRRVME